MSVMPASSTQTSPYPEIKSPWLNLARRLQGCAHNQRGYAAITVTVFVDSNGEIIKWTTPTCTTFEPCDGGRPSSKFVEFIRKMLEGA